MKNPDYFKHWSHVEIEPSGVECFKDNWNEFQQFCASAVA